MRLVEFAARLNAEGIELGPGTIDLDQIVAVHPWKIREIRPNVAAATREVTVLILVPGQVFIVDTPYLEVVRRWSGVAGEVLRIAAQPVPGPNRGRLN